MRCPGCRAGADDPSHTTVPIAEASAGCEGRDELQWLLDRLRWPEPWQLRWQAGAARYAACSPGPLALRRRPLVRASVMYPWVPGFAPLAACRSAPAALI